MDHWGYTCRVPSLPSTLGLLGFLLCVPTPALGALTAGFPLQSSQASPVTGAVTISAPAVTPEPGLLGVQFKIDGYVLDALDTTSPFQVVWSAASATDGDHTLTAEARYSSGDIIESAPLSLTVANPTTFNRTLHVDAANGNDGYDGLTPSTAWRTIGRANAAVQAGDTVYLKGTFTGQQLAPAVSGTAARPITFTSLAGQTAVLTGGGSPVYLGGRSYIIFEGISIQNVSPYAVHWTGGSNHNVLRNSTIVNIGNSYGTWGHAIVLTQSSDNLIEGNTITNVGNRDSNSGDSVWLYSGSNRNRFISNTIRDGGHSLFQVSSQQSTAKVSDNVIAKNTLSNSFTTPVILAGDTYGSERTLIEYNKISDAGVGSTAGVYGPRPGIQIQAVNNIIRYNEIFNNAGPGISLNAYIFSWSGGNLLQESIGNQIYHNVFYGNNRLDQTNYPLGTISISNKHGLKVRDNLIANNIFYGNRGGISGGIYYTVTVDQYHNNCDVWPAGSFNGNRIENNILLRQGGTPGEIMTYFVRTPCGGGNKSYTLSGLQSTFSSTIKNNLEANPLFVNEATKDFHLQSGSPAIDAGLVITGIPFNGAAPDLGAYETGGSPPVQSPYLGSPFAIPGVIEAENFDNGGEGVAYHDNIAGNAGGLYRTIESVDIVSDGGTGYKVNNFETGEWLEYTINVTQTGSYRMEVRAASMFSNSAYHLEVDGQDVTGPIVHPNTGNWNVFQNAGRGGIALTAGTHVLRLYSDQQYADINSIAITSETVSDPTPPTVSMTAPANGATVSGTAVTVSASASDNVGVAGVQFKLDGTNLGSEDTISPYSLSWNTTTAANGSHTLIAVARDAAGNTATTTSVSVTVDNARPMISAVAASLPSPFAATISWTTDEASNTQVEYGPTTAYGSLTPLNSALGTTHTQTLTGLAASTMFHYRVRSRDAAGNLAVSGDFTLTTLAPPVADLLVYRSPMPITVDGARLEWTGATAVQFSGLSNGATASLAWDATNLYVVFEVTDTRLSATGIARDGGTVYRDDSVEVYIDTLGDRAGTMQPDDYQFLVNLNNVQVDLRGTGTGKTFAWNGTWTSAVTRQGTLNNHGDSDSSHTVELAIPWAQLGVTPVGGMYLGLTLTVNDSDPTGTPTFDPFDWTRIAPNSYAQPRLWKWIRLMDTVPPPPSSSGTTVTLVPTADTFLNLNTDVNAASTRLNLYTWPDMKVANAVLLKFNLASIPAGSTIQNATLNLSLAQADTFSEPTYTVTAHKVINKNPDLAKATGYTYDGVYAWTATTCCDNGVPLAQGDISPPYDSRAIDKVLGPKSFTLTSLVQEWVNTPSTNFGVLLNSDASKLKDRFRFFASLEDLDPAKRPSLTITYASGTTPPPPAPGDSSPPTVILTAPLNGATVSGTGVTVSAVASDNVGVVGVQFQLDGANLGAEDTSAPYSITWNTALAANGSHTLTAVARDAVANTTSSAGITVNISNAALPPGPTIFTEDFESGTLSGWTDGVDPARHKVVLNPALAHSGSAALEITYPAGDGGWLTHWFMPGYDEVTASYWVKFPAGWQGTTKLIGLYGNQVTNRWSGFGKAGICPNGSDFFVSMVVTENNSGVINPPPGTTRFYTYYPDMAREPDGVTCWGRYGPAGSALSVYNGSPLNLTQGDWHQIRLYVKANTPGVSNGQQTLWIDGVLKADWQNIRFRDTANLAINALQLSASASPPIVEKLYVDDIVVTAGAPAADTIRPTVSITAPAVNAIVSGTIAVSANASDNLGVSRVEFYVDGILKNTDTASPYAFSWDTTNGGTHPCNGAHTHTLTVKAFDAANNSGTSAGMVVNMNNPSYCPVTPPPPPSPTGISVKYPGDIGIENDPNVIWSETFNEGTIPALAVRYDDVLNQAGMSLSTDVPPGSGSSHSLLMTAIGGQTNGAHLFKNLARIGKSENDTAYLRYYVKYQSPFTQHHSSVWMGGANPTVNWPNPRAGTKPAGNDRFIVASEPVQQNMRFDNYVYWKDMHSDPNGSFWGNDLLQDPNLRAPLDQWMCVETMVKLNNPVSATNGELAFWIDGQKKNHLGPGFPNGTWTWDSFYPGTGSPFPGFQWRIDPALDINWLWLEHYADTTPAGQQSRMLLSNVVLAKSYVGCLSAQTVSNAAPPPPSGLVALWKFDESSGTIASDASGSGNTGTLTNGPTWTTGKIGGGIHLDGVDDSIQVSAPKNLNLSSTITIAGWVNPDTISGTYRTIAVAGSSGLRGYGANFYYAGLNLVKVGSSDVTSSVQPAAGSWQHVAVTWIAATSEVKFYLNGSLVQTIANAAAVTPPLSTDPFVIGAWLTGGSYFQGSLDDLRVYNQVLTITDITNLYNAGALTPPPSPTPIPLLSQWEANMTTYGLQHCNNPISLWEGDIWYYDGEWVFYQIADYSQDSSWNACAQKVEQIYRDQYVLPNDGGTTGWRIFPHGLYQDFVRTGDAQSKTAGILLSKNAAYARDGTPLAWTQSADLSREVAYSILSYIHAEKLGEPKRQRRADLVNQAYDHMAQWFGRFAWPGPWQIASTETARLAPFMVGLTAHALIEDWEETQDPRLIPTLKKAADWMWANAWIPALETMWYEFPDAGVACCAAGAPAPDLNMLIAPIYAFLYRQTGDIKYRDEGDALFAGGVKGAWLGGGKQFSQQYRLSFKYVQWRQ